MRVHECITNCLYIGNKKFKQMKTIKLILIVLLLVFYSTLKSQNQNSNWIYGFEDTIYNENCGKILWHCDKNGNSIKYIDTELNFESTAAAISDAAGHLLLYTNGCSIADSTYKVIKNGYGLNPGVEHDKVCGEIGYTVPNGAMFLAMDNNNKFVLIHLAAKNDSSYYDYGPLYYTVIEKREDHYEVIEKNVIILKDSIESFSVIRHANGLDWWIIVPRNGSNKYYKFLFTYYGIEEKGFQEVGLDLPDEFCRIPGLSGFSPDGRKYVRYNRSCGILLFDFDRCTGDLKNGIYESVGYFADDLSSDFTFSPDSKYIYISKFNHHRYFPKYYENKLYKLDLNAIGIKANPFDVYDLYYYHRIGRFYTDVDSTLYLLYAFSSNIFNEIDEKKLSNNELIPDYFVSPVLNAMTVPYFANYSIGEIDCSTDKTHDLVELKEKIKISPIPFHNKINIEPQDKKLKYNFNIIDINGQVIYKSDKELSGASSIYLPQMKQGIYIYHFILKGEDYFIKAIKI